MSTEPNLGAALEAIKTKTQTVPELASMFGDARDEMSVLRHRIEENRHAQKMASIAQGRIGGILGAREEKPGNIAFIVILICFFIIGIAFWRMDLDKQFEQFLKLVGVLTAIITAAMGYLFGSSHK